ncbi:MAG TPA: DUF2877 domain-containing protein [Acidimicrobiia bacterium]|nr:DUF2877 domain-containing protein [Acidimicrobiia bacterium]
MPLTALTIGAFTESALRTSPGPWKVVASFEKAAYLSHGSEIIVVTSRQVPPGPLYVTVDADRVQAKDGAVLNFEEGHLGLGPPSVTLTSADVWAGVLPEPQQLSAQRAMIMTALAPVAGQSALAGAPYSRPAKEGLQWLQQGDLDVIAWSIIGLGPGFTPAGDDALAGLLVTAIASGRLGPGEWSIDPETARRTSLISLAFLRCAAAGQAIAPVHDVLMAGAAGEAAACRAACAELAAVGGTSGADIAFGMWAGLQTPRELRARRPRSFHPLLSSPSLFEQ